MLDLEYLHLLSYVSRPTWLDDFTSGRNVYDSVSVYFMSNHSVLENRIYNNNYILRKTNIFMEYLTMIQNYGRLLYKRINWRKS